ncbi:hypothetical protein LWI29_004561 [Acer saccharum]|uniref:Uncharacterized protein n=1 Tax=Acer saccharum TaxID=4024 RepID=A0AA39T2E6_ACESA|nr:hypothetical protein LWI29_004561 [Acer saccharum]
MALLVGGFKMPKTMLQLPNFKPYKQRSGNMIICQKPNRPPGSKGSGPHINRGEASPPKTEKQLENSKEIKGNDGSTTKKPESSSS